MELQVNTATQQSRPVVEGENLTCGESALRSVKSNGRGSGIEGIRRECQGHAGISVAHFAFELARGDGWSGGVPAQAVDATLAGVESGS